jgi:hypothetical protein
VNMATTCPKSRIGNGRIDAGIRHCGAITLP